MAITFSKYRPKTSSRLAAIEITDANIEEIASEVGGKVDVTNINNRTLIFPTLDGIQTALVGQYLVKDKTGKLSALDGPAFLAEYEIVP